MRRQGWLLSTMLLLALAPLAAQAAGSGRTQWKLNTFTWVKRVAAEPGAPANAQPAALTKEALQALLGPVQARVEGQDIPLFAQTELTDLAKALQEALALAQPGEDLILLSTHKRDGGFLQVAVGLTARLFVRNGALNLIVHDARLGFMDRYLADSTLPEFKYGSRGLASPAHLQAPGATQVRTDWLALPLAAAAPTPVVAPASAPPPSKVVPEAPAPTPTPVRDAAFFEAQTQRLKALKRLREQDLLSEAEYQEKREAILKTL